MGAIRHYLFVVVGLLGIGGLVSWAAAFWTAVGLAMSLGVRALATVTATVDRHAGSPWALRLMIFFPVLSMAVALAAAIMIGRRFGWVTGVASLALYFGYFAMRR
ncbi:MAG TPA: hypothetical protein VGG03_09270 [Thermoanaerobaculia bacterium]|jgi:hypothetical protein